MNIHINGVNLIVSLKIKRMIQKKFIQKLDDKKYKDYTVKFEMTLPGAKNPLFAENKHNNLTAAITGLREQIEKQIKKYKHA